MRSRGIDTGARHARALVAALLVGAAAGRAPAQEARAVESVPPHASLPFAPGERLAYRVKFGFIGIGTGSIEVLPADTIRTHGVWPLRFTVHGGIPGFRVDDVMESAFDPVRLLSLRFSQELHEGSKQYSRRYDFFPEQRLLLERGAGEKESVAQPLDEAAFLYFVRTRPLEVGRSYDFPHYFKPDRNPVTLKVLRKERVEVPAGTFDCIVVQPIFKTSGIFSEGGRAEVWLSDDAARLVVQMKSRLSFGSLNLYLTRIERPAAP